ncbi:MAG: aquaporin [bacterium]|nr:aquaporin [bacterium]
MAGTATLVNKAAGVSVGGALLLEIVFTAVFIAVILKVTTSKRNQGTVFAAISLTLVAIHLAAAPLSGASVNPGRTLGSAIIGNEYADIWIYIVGPLAGAALGWVLYRLVTAGEIDESTE